MADFYLWVLAHVHHRCCWNLEPWNLLLDWMAKLIMGWFTFGNYVYNPCEWYTHIYIIHIGEEDQSFLSQKVRLDINFLVPQSNTVRPVFRLLDSQVLLVEVCPSDSIGSNMVYHHVHCSCQLGYSMWGFLPEETGWWFEGNIAGNPYLISPES